MYRKGVSVLIFNKNKELLLVNLISFEEKYFAIPGGGLEYDETLEDAVYREIQEELGIEKDTLEYVGESDEPLRFKFKEIQLKKPSNISLTKLSTTLSSPYLHLN